MASSLSICTVFFFSFFLCSSTFAQVPSSKTFKIVNEGDLGDYITEYGANYRLLPDPLFRFPFQFCFQNTTPGSYILALRMGSHRVESTMRWVWQANRNRPVGENATLSFGRDGNLVLADADGTVAWHTNTANRGVVDISLLPDGNLVLLDKKQKYVWQSFDHPTDTLLAGQAITTLSGAGKLISRVSDVDGSDGPYSLVLEKKGLIMYMNYNGKNLNYGGWRGLGPTTKVLFRSQPYTEDAYAFQLILLYNNSASKPAARHLLQSRLSGGVFGDGSIFIILARPNYNATFSFLRLDSDGNLRIYTYYDKVDMEAWDVTFTFFSKDFVRECGLPSKCGKFGLCQRGMCVACPSSKGLIGWSDSCSPPPIARCSTGKKINYFKVTGVEHFTDPFEQGTGPLKVTECMDTCTKDCNCVGFFYREESSKCFTVPVLGTLIKVNNSSHVGYLKYSS